MACLDWLGDPSLGVAFRPSCYVFPQTGLALRGSHGVDLVPRIFSFLSHGSAAGEPRGARARQLGVWKTWFCLEMVFKFEIMGFPATQMNGMVPETHLGVLPVSQALFQILNICMHFLVFPENCDGPRWPFLMSPIISSRAPMVVDALFGLQVGSILGACGSHVASFCKLRI